MRAPTIQEEEKGKGKEKEERGTWKIFAPSAILFPLNETAHFESRKDNSLCPEKVADSFSKSVLPPTPSLDDLLSKSASAPSTLDFHLPLRLRGEIAGRLRTRNAFWRDKGKRKKGIYVTAFGCLSRRLS